MIDPIQLSHSLIFWIFFGIIHTLFASQTVKSLFSLRPQLYRIIYNVTNTLTFLVAVYFSPSIFDVILSGFDLNRIRLVTFLLVSSFGGLISLWGLSYWDFEEFLGLSVRSEGLETSGPYQFSRHPVYSGIIIALFSLLIIEISTATLVWLLGLGGYFVLGTIPEEMKLEKEFGEEYSIYRNNVGRLFPTSISQLLLLLRRS